MKSSSSLLSLAASILATSSAAASSDEQCFGHDPMPSVSTFLGATLDYSVAQRICCNNHRWAEQRGYLASPDVDLFGKLDPTVETVFYDSVCGLPLFIAPRGRSFEDFKEESLKHGWPSFRPEEMVSENVILHDDGRMESRCLTHLGHNLPEGGVDRYCIDLVCVAGAPLSLDDATPRDDERAAILTRLDESTILHDEFDPAAYESSAEEYSGKTGGGLAGVVLIVGIACAAALAAAVSIAYLVSMKKTKNAGECKECKSQDTADDNVVDAEMS